MLFQVLLTIVAIFFVVRTYKRYRTKKVNFRWFAYCFIFAVAVVIVVINPAITDFVAKYVGVGRGADLVIYSSLVILFIGLFVHIVHLDAIDKNLTDLVRKIALDNAKQPKKNDAL